MFIVGDEWRGGVSLVWGSNNRFGVVEKGAGRGVSLQQPRRRTTTRERRTSRCAWVLHFLQSYRGRRNLVREALAGGFRAVATRCV